MRVAIFTDNDFDKVNGVTTTLKAVLRFSEDIEPRVYTAADFRINTPEYFATSSFGVGLPWYREMRVYWPRIMTFAKELKQQQVRVIHVTTPGPVGLAGRYLAHRLGLPMVGSYHTHLGDYLAAYGSPRLGHALERYMRWCYNPCQPLLVPSQASRDHLVRQGYRPDRLSVWGRGVDIDTFSPARVSHAWRNTWHVDHRRPVILYAGRLSREKGLEMIAPLREKLHRHGVAHQFVFVGDGPMRSALEQSCPDAVFLGTLSHDKVGVAMASSDMFLFPSATDSLGNVVLEAQAAGLPVVVSDRGGPREHMVGGQTGFICRAGDSNAFANATITLLRQAALRTRMGHNARAFATERDWPRSLRPLFAAWESAAARTSTAADPAHLVTDRTPIVHGGAGR